MARSLLSLFVFATLAASSFAQPAPASTPAPAAAGAASSGSGGGGGGAAPVAAPAGGSAKKALIGAALRDLTGVLAARPAGAGGAPGAGKLSGAVGTLLSVVLDNNFNGLVSQPQGIFDFGNSGAASIAWPTGNLRQIQRFGELLKNVTTTGDLAAIAPAVGGALDSICTSERFVPQQLVAGGCRSPEVELRMVPAECLVDPKSGEIACRPAYLMLEQRPLSCALPHFSPAQWEGRSCAAFSLIGPKIDFAAGYQEFNVPLPSPQPVANALLSPLRGAGARLLEKVGRKIGGAVGGGLVGGGGSSTSTTAAVGGGNQQG